MNAAAQRERWLGWLGRLADPVLGALAQRRLGATMPVGGHDPDQRRLFTHLEALGRLLAGIVPWLESGGEQDAAGEEDRQRERYRAAAAEAIDAATDPDSPDYMNFSGEHGRQPLVDAAFLAQGLLRAPSLWAALTPRVQRQTLDALEQARSIQPLFNNWLLFAATIEALFCRLGARFDPMRIDYALRQHEQWYRGDGVYGDGPDFHWDYYNSFVIHPMLLDTLDVVHEHDAAWSAMRDAQRGRARRYAVVLERLIGADGSYPPLGRSLTYRAGAFQLLGQVALRRDLPSSLKPGQVREAMTRVLERTLGAPGTFDARGWLQPGLCGHQPRLAERYISTGSLYLTACGLLPLGLDARDAFWTQPGTPTCDRAWAGEDLPADHAQR